ncbi:MAG TPA: PAS domain S-box protein, partial [Acetobacteraceae bacterium]|nr:PAS domain S-box protein [Acetobacteraceae bacterium]
LRAVIAAFEAEERRLLTARIGAASRRGVLAAGLIGLAGLLAAAAAAVASLGAARAERGVSEKAAALAASEARLRALLDQMPVGVALAEIPSGRRLYANPRAEELLGHGKIEVPDLAAYARYGAVHADGRPYAPEEYPLARAVLHGEAIETEEMRYRRGDGRIAWFAVSAATVRTAAGEPSLAVSTFTDITAAMATEVALRESEARFRATFEQAAVGMANVALDGAWLRVNHRLCDMLGYTEAELLARTFQDITHPDDLEADLDNVRRLLAGEVAPYSMEKRYIRKDGATLWIGLTVSLVRDAAGAPLHFISIVVDISARKEAEAALARTLAEQRAIYANAPVGLSAHDHGMRFVAVNERLAAMNGLPVAAHIGRTPREAIPVVAERVEFLLQRVLETGEPIPAIEVETETAAHPGERRSYLASYYPMREWEDGEVAGVSVAVLDITDRKRAETALRDLAANLEARVGERTRQLSEVVAELDAFAYSISHDLRAPLRAMEGFARILVEDHAEGLGPEGRRYANRIVAAAARMEGLIQDLLAYSRLTREAVELAPVDLERALDRALAELREDAPGGAQAEVTVERPLPRVLASQVVLGQILANLLSNAAKFTPPDELARIRVWAEERPTGRVRLWVDDQGIGIAPEHLGRIFHVFERLHGQETYPGSGIGLAIVRKGAERLGGMTGAESGGPGNGSRFWVELLAAPQAAPAAREEAAQ